MCCFPLWFNDFIWTFDLYDCYRTQWKIISTSFNHHRQSIFLNKKTWTDPSSSNKIQMCLIAHFCYFQLERNFLWSILFNESIFGIITVYKTNGTHQNEEKIKVIYVQQLEWVDEFNRLPFQLKQTAPKRAESEMRVKPACLPWFNVLTLISLDFRCHTCCTAQ